MNKHNSNSQENTLYLQLQKDLKKNSKIKREYIPVVVYEKSVCLVSERKAKKIGIRKIISVFTSIVK